MSTATSDGASVNTGVYNGLLTRLKQERPWLITMHCASHRMELAIKDSLAKNKPFEDVKDLMITLFYTMKQSGKFKRHFKRTASALGVQVYSFPKMHGTRFVSHQFRGVKILLTNWIPLAQAIESGLASGDVNHAIRPKAEGILKKLKDVRFLRYAEVYKAYLEVLSSLSLKFEADGLLVHEVRPEIENTKACVEEMEFKSDFTVSGETLTLSKKILKHGHKRRNNKNQEYVTVLLENMKNLSTAESVPSFTEEASKSLNACLESRFKSFDAEIFRKMSWIDPANWNSDSLKQEVEAVVFVADHFEGLLRESSMFNRDEIKLEWRKLKVAYEHLYPGFQAYTEKKTLLYTTE